MSITEVQIDELLSGHIYTLSAYKCVCYKHKYLYEAIWMLQCSNRVFILLNAGLASDVQTVEKKKEKRSAGDIKLCQRVDKMLYAASPVPPFYLQSYS